MSPLLSVAVAGILLATPCEVADLDEAARQRCFLDLRYPAPDRGEESRALQALSEVYAQPRFAGARNAGRGALEALLARLQRWVESLFASGEAATYSTITRFLVLGAAALVALTLLLRQLSALGRSPRATAPPEAKDEAASGETDVQAHLSRARAALATDARAALRHAALGLLALLEVRRLARPGGARTNREVVEALAERGASAEVRAQVGALLQAFDVAWYGGRRVTVEEAQGFVVQVEALWRAP